MDTYRPLSNRTLQDILRLGCRGAAALDSIEASSEILELAEDLSQAALDLRELTLK